MQLLLMMSPRLVLVLWALLATAASEFQEEDGVLVLNKANFEEALSTYPYLMVEFYAPWCGHCEKLAPEYAKAAAELAEGAEQGARVSKVDATEETELAQEFSVKGFPTLVFFKNGNRDEAKKYEGSRNSDAMVRWIRKQMGPPATVVDSAEGLDKVKDLNELVLVGFFKEDGPDKQAFLALAGTTDAVPFAVTSEPGLFSDQGVEKDGLVLFKKFDEAKVFYDGAINKESVLKFIQRHELPMVVEFSSEIANKLFSNSVKVHNVLFFSNGTENLQEIKNNFREVAPEFRDKILFVSIDADVEENKQVLEFFGVEAEDCPTLRLIEVEKTMDKFKPDSDDFSAESLRAFCSGFVEGTLKPFLKSEEVPVDWDHGTVQVLVGKNFEEVAFDNDKNVFVKFYAEWCGHCQKLAPVWDELGDRYQERDDVVIAKMDATKNDLEAFKVTSYPMIKFFPAGAGRKIVDYNGDKTLEAFSKFLDSGGNPESEKAEEAPADDEAEVEDDVDQSSDEKDEL
ncbi:protein disulfide-isomerase-like [Petromyzon marinus]|uniref:protein disulfide-isomerase-like n=1 Tax=Petromyzon marinus TaxID=7757 RepID=UPI003F6E4FF8